MSAPLVLVSGLSGAGRTTVMKALEDLGFYCVDNLPVVLLEHFVELFRGGADRLAAVVDTRERAFLQDFPAIHEKLRARGLVSELVFLEASDEALLLRFDETRRVHPSGAGGVREGIRQERELLAPLAARADLVVDTSRMSVHELKRFVTHHFAGSAPGGRMAIDLVSFAFRRGVPEDCDLMVDVRFLPNPHFEPPLRERDGRDPAVAAYVLESPRGREFLARFLDFVDYLVPQYEEEGKAYLTLAVGCTGGQHRSVAVVEALKAHLRERKLEVRVTHRDVPAPGVEEP